MADSNLLTAEIAEPYAKALMSIAQSSDLVDRFAEDVNFILSLLSESADLKQFLANPFNKAEAKKNVLTQITSETVHPYFLNFLNVLIDRGRIVFLEGVARRYQSLLRKLRQTVLAEVVSAVELNEDQKNVIRQKVIDLVGAREVELEAQVDPSLIGGVIIKVGSQVIDASLRGQLRRIAVSLNTTT